MPLYTYVCPACDDLHDEFRPVEERNDATDCSCGGDKRRFFHPTKSNSIPGIPNRVNSQWKEGGQVLYDPKNPEADVRFKNR